MGSEASRCLRASVRLPAAGWALAFALWVGLAGCGSGRAFSTCIDNGDCETNLTCFQRQCLPLGPVQDGLVWEVALPGAPFSQTFRTPQRLQPLPFSYCEQVVEGWVEEGLPVRVDLEGEQEGLPGRCVADQQVLRGAFSLPLPAGTWRLTLHPPGGPPTTRSFHLERCQTLDLGTLAPPPTTRVRFRPVHGLHDPRPRCGVRVQAFDPTTGDPLSQPLSIPLSSQFECQAPTPHGWELEVALPRAGAGVALVVESASPAAPVMRTATFSVHLEQGVEFVDAGPLPTASVPAERVLLLVEDANGHPVDGVRLVGAWPGPKRQSGCLQARTPPAQRDGSFQSPPARPLGSPGMYELWLPPGPIAFEATPPEATLLATTVVETVVEAGKLHRLILPEKVLLRGGIAAPTGPLPGARLLAQPLGQGRSVETRADAKGGYELWVDPGTYAFFVDPKSVELPYAWFTPGALLAGRRVDLDVLEPRVLAGSWRLPGAHVRAWTVREGHSLLLGEAITDGEGRFVMLISR